MGGKWLPWVWIFFDNFLTVGSGLGWDGFLRSVMERGLDGL